MPDMPNLIRGVCILGTSPPGRTTCGPVKDATQCKLPSRVVLFRAGQNEIVNLTRAPPSLHA